VNIRMLPAPESMHQFYLSLPFQGGMHRGAIPPFFMLLYDSLGLLFIP
jgi:hypothetical protein